ncbi:MAG: META domain-containing protein [Deltaproteobacteria bacterium]|nr:META domain-containing protein [Deltaproteobacteria bacterium]MBW2421305.1 META domain-containing protein [Deltaproteobacteria bacterium]
MTHRRTRLGACTMFAVLSVGAAAPAAAPTLEELAAATYAGIYDTPVTLTQGHWKGKPYDPHGATAPAAGLVDGFRLSGDLNADGADEAVAMLWFSRGGTGTFGYVVVVGREDGKATPLGIAEIGDRVQVRAARIEAARIVFDTIQAGPQDPACCPGQSFRRGWELSGGKLREVASEDRGPASVALIADVEWQLDEFTPDASLPAGVEVTLSVKADRVGGSSGCNRYGASIADGEGPGSIRIGPTMGTRRACRGDATEVERRFLEALSHVERFGFVAGRLTLSWSHEDRYGTLIFSPR